MASVRPARPGSVDLGILAMCSPLAGLGPAELQLLTKYLDRVAFAPSDTVIEEGAPERDMYFVLKGEARVYRGELEVDVVQAGGHFGELGLVAQLPRAASVRALTDLEVARLSADRYEALATEHPALALRFDRILMASLRARLMSMTESVGMLLGQRSLPRHVVLTVHIGGESRQVRTGTLLNEVVPKEIDGRPVIAALMDRRAVSLVTPLTSDCRVEPLTSAHWEGQRMYRRSLALLLLEAGHRIDPGLEVHVEHSVGYGQRVRVVGYHGPLSALADRLERTMANIAALGPGLREEWWTVEEAQAHFREAGWTGATALLDIWRDPAARLLSYGDVYILRNGPLAPNAGVLSGFRVLSDEEGLLLVYGRDATRRDRHSEYPSDTYAAAEARAASKHTITMTGDLQRWLRTLRITSVGQFNKVCIEGNVSQLIRVAEGFQEKRISSIADEVRDRGKDVKVICVAGPSSSGKTTFIRRLKVQLQVNGIHPVGLSLDDYYVDREDTPLDEEGNYDYEAFDALRIDLMQDHVTQLLEGKRVQTAHYDFQTGESIPEGGPVMGLGSQEILMLEGIHGLNPGLLSNIGSERVFRIFICPLTQLPFDRASRVHASDVRLLRRIVRDRHSRGTNAADNIARWSSVRRGERRHIFPYQSHADAVFDSSLIYELSVLKVFAERYLLEVPHDHEEFATAHRLLRFLDRFVSIYPEHVPPTSLLREFIGGSGFEY